MTRKYGHPGDECVKVLQKKTHLQVCEACGNNKEVGILCPYCYDKVRKETEAIKEKIYAKLKLKPVDTDVVVLYEGEKKNENEEFWNGKRIIEMDKPRPMWFGKNLLQKSTQGNADTKSVKPDELG
jgi:large subunit ribosomal protein L32